MVLDATKQDIHKDLLERELESVGIRLNQRPPNIYFKAKTGGGLHFNSTCALTYVDEKLVRTILHEYKVQHSCTYESHVACIPILPLRIRTNYRVDFFESSYRGEYSVRVPAPWRRLSFFKIWPFSAEFHITHMYSN